MKSSASVHVLVKENKLRRLQVPHTNKVREKGFSDTAKKKEGK